MKPDWLKPDLITTAEQFWCMLDESHEDLSDEWDYWDETLSNDWDDDLDRPDDYLITCTIKHKNYPIKFQITKKALDEYITIQQKGDPQKFDDYDWNCESYKKALEKKDKPTITTFT